MIRESRVGVFSKKTQMNNVLKEFDGQTTLNAAEWNREEYD